MCSSCRCELAAALPGVREPVALLQRHGSALVREWGGVAAHGSRRQGVCGGAGEGSGRRGDHRLPDRFAVQGRRADPAPDVVRDRDHAVLACVVAVWIHREYASEERPGVRERREHGKLHALPLRNLPGRLRRAHMEWGAAPATGMLRLPSIPLQVRQPDNVRADSHRDLIRCIGRPRHYCRLGEYCFGRPPHYSQAGLQPGHIPGRYTQRPAGHIDWYANTGRSPLACVQR